MLSEIEFDTEKHDLTRKVAKLQEQLEQLNNYNHEVTELKSIIKFEITIIIFKTFGSHFYSPFLSMANHSFFWFH